MTLAAQDAPTNGNTDIEKRKPSVIDESQFANLLDTSRFEHLWRVSQLFAGSQMVPEHFRGKPNDCFICVQMAIRLGVDPFMFLQNTYVVYGRPGMEAKLAIALINTSGLFADSLDYEVVGEDPSKPPYKVRAFAVRKTTGKRVDGPWVDWATVKAEGWDGKSGSKWKTIPALMFQYRAATFFGRLHCPERMMGMQTADEVEEVGPPKRIENTLIERPAKPFGPAEIPHPTDENQTIDTKDASDPTEDRPMLTPEDAAPAVDLSSYEYFHAAMTVLAVKAGIQSAGFEAAMGKIVLAYAVKTKTSARRKVYEAALHGALDWTTGTVVD